MDDRRGTGRADLWVWPTWALANVVGMAIVLAGNGDDRVVTLGRDHGPSAIEAVGVGIVVAGWVLLDTATIRRWPLPRWSSRARTTAGVAAVAGLIALVPAVVWAPGSWWVIGAAILGAVQLSAARSVLHP